jgi:Tfp pilus assembly protein PilP
MSEYVRWINRARPLAGLAVAMLLNIGGLGAQSAPSPQGKPQPAPAPATPAPAAPAQPGPAASGAVPPSVGAYTYRAEGRRDPFVSLVGRGNEATPAGSRPAGVAGLLINEISIKGIVRAGSGFIAMVQGADNRAYVVRAGDRLMDGTVKAIVQDAVVFSQDVNDPLSLVKQKEIRKNLRSTEGGRG